jgi:hypothetical protein
MKIHVSILTLALTLMLGACSNPVSLSVGEIVLSSGLKAQTIEIGDANDLRMAVGSQPHLLYGTYSSDTGKSRLIYAQRNDNGKWLAQSQWPMPGNSPYGSWHDLVLDQRGRAHISCSYSDGNNENLLYINNTMGLWLTTTVSQELSVGLDNLIAVDNSGKVHLMHYFWNDHKILYTTKYLLTWVTVTIEEGHPIAICTDSQNGVHLFYGNELGVRHAYKPALLDDWAVETVPQANSYNSSIKIADNDIVIATQNELLTGHAGTWQTTDVYGQIFADNKPNDIRTNADSLAVDSAGKLHLSFSVGEYDYQAGDYSITVWYANNIGGVWQAKIIDRQKTDNYGALDPRIGVSKSGLVHLIYARPNSQTIVYTSFPAIG